MNLHGVLNKGQGRLRVGRGTAMALTVGLAMMGGIATAVTASATTHDKVWVCKYVSTPGDETPQHADGIISVSTNTLKDFKDILPFWFADAQGPSMAFRWD